MIRSLGRIASATVAQEVNQSTARIVARSVKLEEKEAALGDERTSANPQPYPRCGLRL